MSTLFIRCSVICFKENTFERTFSLWRKKARGYQNLPGELLIIIPIPTSGRSGHLFAKHPQLGYTVPTTTLRHIVIEGGGVLSVPF